MSESGPPMITCAVCGEELPRHTAKVAGWDANHTCIYVHHRPCFDKRREIRIPGAQIVSYHKVNKGFQPL